MSSDMHINSLPHEGRQVDMTCSMYFNVFKNEFSKFCDVILKLRTDNLFEQIFFCLSVSLCFSITLSLSPPLSLSLSLSLLLFINIYIYSSVKNAN